MSAQSPTAEERARWRSLADIMQQRDRIMGGAFCDALDALDTAERERDDLLMCPGCGGFGVIHEDYANGPDHETRETRCERCDGKGRVDLRHEREEAVKHADESFALMLSNAAKAKRHIAALERERDERPKPATPDSPDRPHIVGGEFQSDKYPTTPRGKVPLSTKDPTAQDLLWEYAQRRREVDAQFADDLEWSLQQHGYAPAADPRDARIAALEDERDGHIAIELHTALIGQARQHAALMTITQADARARIAALEDEAEEYSNELDDYETAVDDNLEGVIIDSEDGEGNRIERIEFAGAEVERLRADLARVTGELAEANDTIANCQIRKCAERIEKLQGELAEIKALADGFAESCRTLLSDLSKEREWRSNLEAERDAAVAELAEDASADLVEAEADREKLQGERDAAQSQANKRGAQLNEIERLVCSEIEHTILDEDAAHAYLMKAIRQQLDALGTVARAIAVLDINRAAAIETVRREAGLT